MKLTKKAYQEHLDEMAPEYGSSLWIIGGTLRFASMAANEYGKAIRKHDPVSFRVGYKEWVRENQ